MLNINPGINGLEQKFEFKVTKKTKNLKAQTFQKQYF